MNVQNLIRNDYVTFEHMPKYIFRQTRALKLEIEKNEISGIPLEKPSDLISME